MNGDTFPDAILSDCTEPIVDRAPAMRCDGTGANGVNDVAEFDQATPITVVSTFEDGVHVLRPVGVPIEVRRWRDGDALMWQCVGVTCRLTHLD